MYIFISKEILRKIKYIHLNKKKIFYIKNKSTTLNKKLKQNILYIYNGKTYILFNWNYKKLGYKMGNFINTKKF
uniref:30S ribosomal protein S19 n=1 Tax=Nephromyces sp. ex Molgula occidentalis TaxID=2544991 RepID=A0A5C1H7P6_9APIC|nr:30S ribosomal protein S19 [Nephromyces sp. ex Molgula occidentalis]